MAKSLHGADTANSWNKDTKKAVWTSKLLFSYLLSKVLNESKM